MSGGAQSNQVSEPSVEALLKPVDVSKITGLSISTLAKHRMTGDGPPFVKLGHRRVAYRRQAIDEWIAARERTITLGERRAQNGGD